MFGIVIGKIESFPREYLIEEKMFATTDSTILQMNSFLWRRKKNRKKEISHSMALESLSQRFTHRFEDVKTFQCNPRAT